MSSSYITPLPTPTSTKLRSTLVVPTFPQIISELAQNSLDAGSRKIEVTVDLRKGFEGVRVVDDGCGVDREGLKKIGKRFRTSKTLNDSGLGSIGSFGFRGEALASLASVSLISITSRASGSSSSHTKIVRSSKTLFEGVHSSRTIHGSHGTRVEVRDIFHNIPVRREELSKVPEETLLKACKRVIETLALGNPGVDWTVWQDRGIGMGGRGEAGSKKVMSISGTKSSLDVFRALFGSALTRRVQKIRVSAGVRRVDGFISLSGDVTKSHQHLYVNNHPVERGDLHMAISKKFATSRFATYATLGEHDDLDDATPQSRRSPRRLERYPIYILNISLPSNELDIAYEPRKGVLGYKDLGAVRGMLMAVVDEYLKRNGYGPIRRDTATPSPTKDGTGVNALRPLNRLDPSAGTASLHGKSPLAKEVRAPLAARDYDLTRPMPISFLTVGPDTPAHHEVDGIDCETPHTHIRPSIASPLSPEAVPRSDPFRGNAQLVETEVLAHRHDSKDPDLDDVDEGTVDDSGRRRFRWISDLQERTNTSVLLGSRVPSFRRSIIPLKRPLGRDDNGACLVHIRDTPTANSPLKRPIDLQTVYGSTMEIQIPQSSLQEARIIGQVDTKYVAVLLELPRPTRPASYHSAPDTQGDDKSVIVLVDQHAADERVSVESILSSLCAGFRQDTMPTTELMKATPMILLTRLETEELTRPGVLEVFRRWGIHLVLPGKDAAMEGDYVQVGVQRVPSILAGRLGKNEAVEMTRLVRSYLSVLSEDLGGVQSLIRSYGEDQRKIAVSECGVDAREEEGKPCQEAAAERFDVQSAEEEERDAAIPWGHELRYMPREMLELANSKACRGEQSLCIGNPFLFLAARYRTNHD
ncbi:hypothetical protein I316_07066 [Kwoniella heveanensis BCC8398]|uniref:MutL C-terminal dimerisation domain-containing protein n=1 Tax=Kwoniella heveanensis BCC8398 TaxID=1296120 RepID=A0A1B9GJK9_9TREE|nr:hypothetical protein I316_07066 [Kwoniella heveanensis BCC8398]